MSEIDNNILIEGKKLESLPENLYIPPDALEVILKSFSGPLDLLLYLIRKQNLDILNIPIASITQQYIEYIRLMKIIKLELVAEYLLMAALLAHIKSQMLLPTKKDIVDEDEDPRAELVRRLQEYEMMKKAATHIDNLPRQERDYHLICLDFADKSKYIKPPQIKLDAVFKAFVNVLQQASLNEQHKIGKEQLSLRATMSEVLSKLDSDKFKDFYDLFNIKQGVAGIVITFLAILELVKESIIHFQQSSPQEPIYVRTTA
ncbi:MAG: segregation/condensation protein A [Gammaproteobacteria bacterium]|nr:MAG: segregation/condensation protein A [Gammaproteobacteria bacterium]